MVGRNGNTRYLLNKLEGLSLFGRWKKFGEWEEIICCLNLSRTEIKKRKGRKEKGIKLCSVLKKVSLDNFIYIHWLESIAYIAKN